ncbi:MAG: DDE-type integrase/transposase/recombinase [Bacteroides thetaiotaomicron]|nr:DDE-type integrase/transposase/recombinase [Bacteroides thetaiotaomicron]
METEQERKEQMDIAQMRFGIIAPMVQGTYAESSMAAYCRRVAQNPMRLPDGRLVQYQPKTIEKWYSLYMKGGMDALTPKTRRDKGSTRVITPEAEQEIRRIHREYPRLNATQIWEKLVHDSILPATVSVSSVQRYVKKHGLRGSAGAEKKDRKAFEAAYFGEMWQADTCYLPYIKENGKSHRTYLIMILDDYSRMIVGGRLFYQENAANFQQVLRDAVAAYGIPHKLYVDNGAPYSNGQLSYICGGIGTVLLHAPVRDGAAKGKVERNFRTLKERWLYGVDVSQVRSLEEFNRMLSSYIRKHNTTVHSGTGKTPLARYLETNHRIRRPESRDWLEESFHNRQIRRVNRDATVHLSNICYDAPMQFIGQKVEVRFLPGDEGSAYILYGGVHYPLRVTDRVANGNTRRQKGMEIDYGKEGDGNVH